MTDFVPLVLRVAEICTLLDICENTAYSRIDVKGAPFQHAYKEGRTYRVPTADVVDYLIERHVPVPASLQTTAA